METKKSSGVIFSVKLPDEVAEKVNKIIEEKGCTKNYFLRKAIIAYIEPQPEQITNTA